MFALLDMSSSSDEENSCDSKDKFKNKNRFRFATQVLNISNCEFQKKFRMNKETFLYILHEITPHLRKTYRVTAISKEAQLAITLRFLVTGDDQKGIANDLTGSLSQSKVSEAISECLTAMEISLCPKWIRFNVSPEKEMEIKTKFCEKFGIPGVIGCVGGTHVKIRPPKENVKHLYCCRKGFYSLNVMLICNSDLVITYVDSRHPGGNTDAFIWSYSEANTYLRNLHLSGKSETWLLGGGGYECLPYLLTPYKKPLIESELKFNIHMANARNTIDSCISILKNRFKCISGERNLHYKEDKAKKMVNVCCALHNICLFFKNESPPMDESQGNCESIELEEHLPASPTSQTIRD